MDLGPANPVQARIGRAIRQRRQKLGLSLTATAAQLGVAISTLSKLENGLVPITFERLDSISRLMPAVAAPQHRENAALLRRLMAVYARSEDLVRIGAYKPGSDEDLDRALRARSAMRGFLCQTAQEQVRFSDSLGQLAALCGEI